MVRHWQGKTYQNVQQSGHHITTVTYTELLEKEALRLGFVHKRAGLEVSLGWHG